MKSGLVLGKNLGFGRLLALSTKLSSAQFLIFSPFHTSRFHQENVLFVSLLLFPIYLPLYLPPHQKKERELVFSSF